MHARRTQQVVAYHTEVFRGIDNSSELAPYSGSISYNRDCMKGIVRRICELCGACAKKS